MIRKICGPSYDKRLFNLSLPPQVKLPNRFYQKLFLKNNDLLESNNIAVLVSGGIDSALLYFLLHISNIENNTKWNIVGYTVDRKDGSKYFALKVMNWIHNYFSLNEPCIRIVGNNMLPANEQVESGINDVLINQCNYAYIGVIDVRPEHAINIKIPKVKETNKIKYPFVNLQKSHIIDLYSQYSILDLIPQTHSCNINKLDECGYCNGCKEREWGLKEMGLTNFI